MPTRIAVADRGAIISPKAAVDLPLPLPVWDHQQALLQRLGSKGPLLQRLAPLHLLGMAAVGLEIVSGVVCGRGVGHAGVPFTYIGRPATVSTTRGATAAMD